MCIRDRTCCWLDSPINATFIFINIKKMLNEDISFFIYYTMQCEGMLQVGPTLEAILYNMRKVLIPEISILTTVSCSLNKSTYLLSEDRSMRLITVLES